MLLLNPSVNEADCSVENHSLQHFIPKCNLFRLAARDRFDVVILWYVWLSQKNMYYSSQAQMLISISTTGEFWIVDKRRVKRSTS